MRDQDYFNKLRQKNNMAFDNWEASISEKKRIEKQLITHNRVVRKVDFLIDDIDREFAKKAKLDIKDMQFVFLATSLQVIRQLLLTRFVMRVDHRAAERFAVKPKEKLSSINIKEKDMSGLYYASMQDIILKPGVPYDITADLTINKAHLSGNNHRNKTWGHDPVFGYIFGTANILTNTLTYSSISGNKLMEIGCITTKHVGYVQNGQGRNIPSMIEMANTGTMFLSTLDRLKQQPIAVGAAVLKQYAHIKSDEYSKLGLPLPGTNLAPNISRFLTEAGLDYANIKTISMQAMCAELINYIIRVLYFLYSKKTKSKEMDIARVKANRIITISGLLEEVIVTSCALLIKDPNMLDIGNLLILIKNIMCDIKFRNQIEEQFIQNRLYEMMEEN